MIPESITSINIEVSLRSQRGWLVNEQVFLTDGKVAEFPRAREFFEQALFSRDGL